MKILPRVLTGASVAAATATAAAAGGRAPAPPTSLHDIRHSHARARVLCEIPPRDYVSALPSSGRAITYTGVLIRAIDLPPELNALHSRIDYVLSTASVGVGHCSISRVVLSVWDDGSWTLNFRADQNPLGPPFVAGVLPGSSVPSRAPLILPGSSTPTIHTDHIKRNQFTVTVRGMAEYADPADAEAGLGRPVLFVLSTGPFWVQRGVPIFPKFEGVDSHVRASFRRVDRVEVELSYR